MHQGHDPLVRQDLREQRDGHRRYAEARDENRKPATGMIERLEKTLTSAFGDEAVLDKGASFMCGDSAYKPEDTRPDGSPGVSFSNSDRKLAENAGLRFEQPQHTFGWALYGEEGFENFAARSAFVERFRVDRRAEDGPLMARLKAR